jgi:hypothetical protein
MNEMLHYPRKYSMKKHYRLFIKFFLICILVITAGFGIAGSETVIKSIRKDKPVKTRTFYFDGKKGNDSSYGLSPKSAWKSLSKIEALKLQPGDHLLLKCGTRFNDQSIMLNRQSGSLSNPIKINSYGKGQKPVINVGELPGHCSWLLGCRNIIIEKNTFRNAHGWLDSYGFHLDIANENCIVQYNLSMDNAGGFVQVLGKNKNCSYRYNISINDGWRVKGNLDGREKIIKESCLIIFLFN